MYSTQTSFTIRFYCDEWRFIMANITGVHGAITIKANDLDTIYDLYKALSFLSHDNIDYYTDLLESDIEDKIINENGEHQVSIPFEGSGRWEYLSNIEYAFKWIDELGGDIKGLNDYDFSIIYDYKEGSFGDDEDESHHVFGRHTKGQDIFSIVYQES